MGNITVGELRVQCAYMDGSDPLIVISTDRRLSGMVLRVVAFFPDSHNPHTKEPCRCFKIKVEVDDLGTIPGEEGSDEEVHNDLDIE